MAEDDKKKKEEVKQQQQDDEEDARLEFLLAYLTKSYKLKQEKWNKMIAIEENKVSENRFSVLKNDVKWRCSDGDHASAKSPMFIAGAVIATHLSFWIYFLTN